MAKISKRMKALREKVDANKLYDAVEALELVKSLSTVKFTESVDVAINLGVDPRKSDQVVRGASTLPNGTGKSVRVAVFAQDANAEAAKAAGADKVGFEDLADEIKRGEIDFDVVIATPDAMRVVGQLGTILGPKGLMPNPKVGTVTQDVEKAVKDAKGGQVRFRTDKNGIIHCSVGNVSFEAAALKQNIEHLIADLNKLKPASAKGVFLQKVAVSSTMGVGVGVDVATLEIAK
ncbi:MAG: 50S ribosomal protein L1 [Gammaproteobacteria bacterium]|nr:MAG: 50S ribosomal protein L1 [Gammaproteobacteria bacterium]